MAEGLGERLGQLEQAVRRAAELIGRLKAERAALEREGRELRARLHTLEGERKDVLAQVEGILRELDRLEETQE
jgi:chromosome segregation ATPase